MVISEIKALKSEGNVTGKRGTFTEIAQFYTGKTIFVTGGTGFLGKVLIEKVLYTCDVKKIYMLVRDKKGQNAQERSELFFNDVLFDRIRNDKPEAMKKIEAVAGDLTAVNLGFDDHLKQVIVENVSVVFHAAATIKFFEPIQKAININVHGTQHVLALAQEMKKLEAFIYVSTAYSNTNQKIVEERVYPPPMSLEKVNEFIRTHKQDSMKETLKFIGDRPNTYTFTKAIAEHEVFTKRGKMPVAIVRPSVVTPIYKQPLPGWTANWNGPTWFYYMAAQGFFRMLPGADHFDTNLIPVDVLCNGIIVAATRCQKSEEIKVYNYCTQPRNSLDYRSFSMLFINAGLRRRHNKLPCPGIFMIPSMLLINILHFLFIAIPAFIGDIYLRIVGEEPRFGKIAKWMMDQTRVYEFVTTKEWQYKDDNVQKMVNSMSQDEQKLFYCDPAKVDWCSYIDRYYMGVRKYLVDK